MRIGANLSSLQGFRPTLKKLAKEYTGKATIMTLDKDRSPKLAKYFGGRGIPDCCVIVGNDKGKYIYMQKNGKTTTIRSKAKILETRKEVCMKKF